MTYLRIEHYRDDLVICRPPFAVSRNIPNRSECGAWSWKSRRRLRFVAANTGIQFRAMITLTYPSEFPCVGSMTKKHVKTFLEALRRFIAPSECLSYLWWFEFQQRGAPHFHMLVNRPCRDLPEKQWFSATWYRIVGSGDVKHLQAGTRVENLRTTRGGVRYAIKYAQKMRQKTIPPGFRDVGRFWAHSRNVAPYPSRISYVECIEELAESLAGWKYVGVLANPYVTTLYGAAPYLLGKDGLSNDPFYVPELRLMDGHIVS